MCVFYIHHGLPWLAGGLIDSPRPQNIAEPLETVSLRPLKAAWGLRVSADVSLSIWKVPWLPGCSLIWLGHYILYCINMRPHLPNKSSYLPWHLSLSQTENIPFGTQMFYLCIIWILCTDSLCNIHSPYNLGWLLCTLPN